MTTEETGATPVVAKDVPKDNFWEVGQYKNAVIKIDNGMRQCEELMAFIKDRALLEEQYCKGLREWKAKHHKVIEKGTAYNTVKTAWLDTLKEADRVAKLHLEMKEQLLAGPYAKVKQWKSDNYHAGTLLGIKESKMFAHEFYLAQKPWRKKCRKLNRVRKRYLAISRAVHTVESQAEASLKNDLLPPEKVARTQSQAAKKTQEKNKVKQKYTEVMIDTEKTKDHYIENMERVFSKCQNLEEKRLDFFKQTFLEMHTILDLSSNPSYAQAFEDVRTLIYRASAQDDVRWWWKDHGPGMPFYTPQFQEYDPKNPFAVKQGLKRSEKTAISFQSKLPSTEPSERRKSRLSKPVHDPWMDDHSSPDPSFQGKSPNQKTHQSQDFVPSTMLADLGFDDNTSAPWQDFGTDEDSDVAPGDGVLVCAVCSYEGQEADELTFTKDDCFYMIESEDEQGWCKGRLKSGRVGLYPASYVQVVESPLSQSETLFTDFGL